MNHWVPGVLMTYFAFIVAVASPGPNVLAVMGVSMSDGRRAGVALAFGISVGSLSWSLLSVLGLSAVLATYAEALIVIKVAGGIYLIWLGIKAFRSALLSGDPSVPSLFKTPRTSAGYALSGYIIMMTNPKAVLAWIAIVSLGMTEGAPGWVPISIVLGTYLLSLIAHIAYAVGFSTPFMLRIYTRARRGLQASFGTFFIYAGGRLLSDRS